jgi:hypothetical protein
VLEGTPCIGDAWNIQGLLIYGIFPYQRPLSLATAGIDTAYALDIVRIVPLFGFGIDGVLSVRDRSTRGHQVLHALLGVDYLSNPRWLVGADLRGHWIATHAASPLDAVIGMAAVQVGLRFDLHELASREPVIRALPDVYGLDRRDGAAREKKHDPSGRLNRRGW